MFAGAPAVPCAERDVHKGWQLLTKRPLRDAGCHQSFATHKAFLGECNLLQAGYSQNIPFGVRDVNYLAAICRHSMQNAIPYLMPFYLLTKRSARNAQKGNMTIFLCVPEGTLGE